MPRPTVVPVGPLTRSQLIVQEVLVPWRLATVKPVGYVQIRQTFLMENAHHVLLETTIKYHKIYRIYMSTRWFMIGVILLTIIYVTFWGSLEMREGLECKCINIQELITSAVSNKKRLTKQQFCAYKKTMGGDEEGCVWGNPDKWGDLSGNNHDFENCTLPTKDKARAVCVNLPKYFNLIDLNKRHNMVVTGLSPKCSIQYVPPYPPPRPPSPPVIKHDPCS